MERWILLTKNTKKFANTQKIEDTIKKAKIFLKYILENFFQENQVNSSLKNPSRCQDCLIMTPATAEIFSTKYLCTMY